MTLLIPRFLFGVFCCVLLLIIVKVLLIGLPKDKPIKQGCRKTLLRWSYKFFGTLISGVTFFTINQSCHVDCDYSEYLGTETPEFDDKPISTIVCNHVGWFEIFSLIMSPLHPAFTPKSEIRNVPVIASLTQGLQSLYVPRSTP
jgi:1-acyl-sn-glycerol-3-phosphate acyltransferase